MALRRWTATLALLAVFAGLAFYTTRSQKAAPQEKVMLFATGEERAAAVSLRTPRGAVRLERRTGSDPAWWIVEPVVVPVRKEFSPTLDVWIKAAKAKEKVADDPGEASRYGLDPAAIEVEVEMPGGDRHGLLIGDRVPIGVTTDEDVEIKFFYVRRAGDAAIYTMASAGVVEQLLQGADGFRNDVPFAFTAEEIHSFSVSGPSGPILAAERKGKDGAWGITTPPGLKADSPQINTLLGRIARLRARGFPGDNPDAEKMKSLGFDQPAVRLVLRLEQAVGGPQEIVVLVGGASQDGSLRYLKREDEPYVYAVEADDWDMIDTTIRRMARGL